MNETQYFTAKKNGVYRQVIMHSVCDLEPKFAKENVIYLFSAHKKQHKR